MASSVAGTTFEVDVVEGVAIAKGQKHGSLITNRVKWPQKKDGKQRIKLIKFKKRKN